MHAVQRARCRCIDGTDARMGNGAAQNGRVKHEGQFDVVDVASLASEQRRILDALDARPEQAARAIDCRSAQRSALRSLVVACDACPGAFMRG
jgi:hypothetical protein